MAFSSSFVENLANVDWGNIQMQADGGFDMASVFHPMQADRILRQQEIVINAVSYQKKHLPLIYVTSSTL